MAQALFKLSTHWKNLCIFLNAFPLPSKFVNHIVTFLSCLFSDFFSVYSEGGEKNQPNNQQIPFLITMLIKLVQVMEGLYCIKD